MLSTQSTKEVYKQSGFRIEFYWDPIPARDCFSFDEISHGKATFYFNEIGSRSLSRRF